MDSCVVLSCSYLVYVDGALQIIIIINMRHVRNISVSSYLVFI